jgi:hypothetical protein
MMTQSAGKKHKTLSKKFFIKQSRCDSRGKSLSSSPVSQEGKNPKELMRFSGNLDANCKVLWMFKYSEINKSSFVGIWWSNNASFWKANGYQKMKKELAKAPPKSVSGSLSQEKTNIYKHIICTFYIQN